MAGRREGGVRYTILVQALAISAMAMQQPEQYPGQRDHAQPPPDVFCSPKGHKPGPGERMIECACEKTCTASDPQNPLGPRYVIEDPKCSVYCWKSACKCKASCET